MSELGQNPKDLVGVKKPRTSLVPSPAIIYLAKVYELGARKYGPYNWRENKVLASVYYEAADRHMKAWYDGEDLDPESGLPHVAHAMACNGIILDALATGNLIDDRPRVGATARLIAEFSPKAPVIQGRTAAECEAILSGLCNRDDEEARAAMALDATLR